MSIHAKQILLFVLAFSFFCPTPVSSQAPPVQAQEGTVLRSTTRLVQVSVVVQDGKGQPITGLKPEDFTVYDEGKQQSIATFVSEGPVPEEKSRPLPFNVFTNRFDRLGQHPSSATAILFDALNTQPQDQSRVRLQILMFLKQLRPEDRVAIYALTTKLEILQEFTQDSASLVNAVQKFLPKSTGALDASSVEQVDLVGLTGNPYWGDLQNALNRSNSFISDQRTSNRVEMTTAAFVAIGNHLSSVSGRKNLIWVSGGFPFQLGLADFNNSDAASLGTLTPGLPTAAQAQAPTGQNSTNSVSGTPDDGGLNAIQRGSGTFHDEILRATRTLSRANIAVYPVDARGVTVEGTTDPSMRDTSAHAGNSQFFSRRNDWDTLNETADQTGGVAFYGSNDVANAMRKAADDGRYAYTLGFYPTGTKWDGKPHQLKVKVKPSGAKLRYRRAYFAGSEGAESAPTAKQEIDAAALSPLESTTLGLMVSGVPLEPAAARKITFQVGLDTLQLSLIDESGHHKGAIDLLFLQRDAQGSAVSAEQKRIGFDFNDQQYKDLVKSGIILQKSVAADRTATEIRVVAHDPGSGATGTVTVPLVKLFGPAK
jgi:VWFA-related protein